MDSNFQYMLRRAREEDDAADRSPSPKVRALHREMADRYRRAARGSPAEQVERVISVGKVEA